MWESVFRPGCGGIFWAPPTAAAPVRCYSSKKLHLRNLGRPAGAAGAETETGTRKKQKTWSTWSFRRSDRLENSSIKVRWCAVAPTCGIVRSECGLEYLEYSWIISLLYLYKIIMHQKGCVYSKVLVCPKSARSFKKCYGKQVEHLFLLEWRSRNILDWLNLVYI